MASDELEIAHLQARFYRDGFTKVLIGIVLVSIVIVCLASLSIYLHITKPAPVYFSTDNEWRVLPPIPLDQPYQSNPDLLQWAGQAFPAAFSYDFLNYQTQLANVTQYFTQAGFQNLLGQLTNYHADYNFLQNNKIFVKGVLSGAPFILNQGLLNEKYAWRIQIPINIRYSNGNLRMLTIVAVVVRVPTLNNLYGVAIDNMSITEAQGNQVKTNA